MAMGVFEEFGINEQTFGVSEESIEKIYKDIQHAEIESKDVVDFCKHAFPSSKEAQIRAFLLCSVASEWDDEGQE